MLLHAGYSASESLAYEKSVDPSSPLQIPLDVSPDVVGSNFCRSEWKQSCQSCCSAWL